MSDEFYILRDRKPVKATWEEYAEWAKAGFDATKRIAVDTVGDVRVSTVFLMIDHSWDGGQPILFETMTFGGDWDEYQWRYRSYDDALAGHAAIVAAIQSKVDPESVEVGA